MLVVAVKASAQQGFYVPKLGKIYFAGDTATIFSNVINYGNFGLDKKAFVNFKGLRWENDPLALLTDETSGTNGIGGWIRFTSDSFRQQINGGYNAASKTGPAFQHLQIKNKFGVEIIESSIKVRKQISFFNGSVYLNDKIFVVGDNNPGTISGYDQNKFFITGIHVNGGILLRESIRDVDGQVVFPVGTQDSAYTPAAVKNNSSIGDDFHVSVFESKRANPFTANVPPAKGVNKIWQIGKMFRPDQDEVEIWLQHLNKDEGSYFTQFRDNSYVSSFHDFIWDTTYPQTNPAIGSLTTGRPLLTSGLNERTFSTGISNNSFFTKFTGFGDTTLKTKLLLGAYRVDAKMVSVSWQTKPEINVKYYIVQRRFNNEISFKNIDTLSSQAINGLSVNYLNYLLYDRNNSYHGLSFYRLQVFDYANTFYYSNTVSVNLWSTFSYVFVWPNPNSGNFNIIVNTPLAKSVVLFNVLGQKIWEADLPPQRILPVKLLLPSATYYLSVVDKFGELVETTKVLIIK